MKQLPVLVWFGLGLGVERLARHSRVVNLIGGVLLVGIGLYDVLINWELISTLF